MKRLTGQSILPLRAKAARILGGRRVRWLRRSDIDRSGRGYFFPREGVIEDCVGRNILISGEWYGTGDFVEMVLIPEPAHINPLQHEQSR